MASPLPIAPILQRYAPAAPPPRAAGYVALAPQSPLGRNTLAELEELTRWLPTITGRGAGLERESSPGRAPTGRPDHVDERHEGLDRARRVLARLESLYASGTDGQHAVFVLWGAHVRGALEPEGIGLLFAERATRRGWLRSDKLGIRHALPRTEGARLLLVAQQVYEDRVTPGTAPGWLQAVADDLDRRAHELATDLEAEHERRKRAYQARVLERRPQTTPATPSAPTTPPEAPYRTSLRRLMVAHRWDVADAARACCYQSPWTLALDLAAQDLGAEVIAAWEAQGR